ncbi:MAG: hypothetical protein WBA97_01085 [Actinophytocola sp.]|uniref:hypothetical protein n=1 Tax=Actinophytocola sp. TaxID=1872138 RepID=UPI003C77C565
MTSPAHDSTLAAPVELTAAELDRADLLHVAGSAQISRYAIFVPTDATGTPRPITIGAGARIGPFAVLHGGVTLGAQARVEEHTIVGKPELGYAVGRVYPGAGGNSLIGEGAVIRSCAVIYADVQIGVNALVGHSTLLRTNVQVGAETQLGHHLTVERATSIGREVRCSPGSHITSSAVLADRVFLGAGVRTINDKTLTWRHPARLSSPGFGGDWIIWFPGLR